MTLLCLVNLKKSNLWEKKRIKTASKVRYTIFVFFFVFSPFF